MQLALRELRAHFADPKVWGSMAVVALLLGLSGPFGTFFVLPTAGRIAYWVAIVVATYGLGSGIGFVLEPILQRRLDSRWLVALVSGLAIGPVVTAAVMLVNIATFGPGANVIDALSLLLNCTLVSVALSGASLLLPGRQSQTVPAQSPGPPAILQRVPLPQRGRLVALSVADHYVEIVTDKGKSLVLIRLSDAIAETGGEPGVQIHRSHWVALWAVSGVERRDGKVIVALTTGIKFPVSRGAMPAVRAAGLIG